MEDLMIKIRQITKNGVTVSWTRNEAAVKYRIYWSDRETAADNYRLMAELPPSAPLIWTLSKSTHVPHRIMVGAVMEDGTEKREQLITPVHFIRREQTERLNRGLVAVATSQGIFLSWRLLLSETTGFDRENRGLVGTDFNVYRDGKMLALVTDSTNYLDRTGKISSEYAVAPAVPGGTPCPAVKPWADGYLDIPIRKPEGGVTPAGEPYEYSANDMSVADVDGDGDYEFIVKWDPSNSHDVSIKGYTGKCYLDCYKLDGRLLWRLDMGKNIRAGAHYTQFMCYDFNGDGKAEIAVKTAPGTKMTVFGEGSAGKGTPCREAYITMPAADVEKGYGHNDSYVCSTKSYRSHLIKVFAGWQDHPEVKAGRWPETLEECFGIQDEKAADRYPLGEADAEKLVDYFLDVYAPSRSPKNKLREFEGFIYEGPEYLTIFGGDGRELETIPFPFERCDDGLLWGDYSMNRIEPCNRVDRFLSGVAYLDGVRPYLIICRGYYTRAAVAAYSFFENRLEQVWSVDSGFVPMSNPFCDDPHNVQPTECEGELPLGIGTDPEFRRLAGQGNHSLSTADVDGDGCMEIIYGAACIDHDGSLLYSSCDRKPDGKLAKMGHGDAMHVADIDPDRPGMEIFNVFEGAWNVPYGYALRDAETGKALFGTYAEEDLGRCMVGSVVPGVRGYQCWVNGEGLYDCRGTLLDKKTPGSNMSIRFAADLTTQITDGVDYLKEQAIGAVNDYARGPLLIPEGTLTNNGTKGNPCLVADIFGDFREEILLRTEDSSAIRIYTSTEVTGHKLFTLMHDAQYRCGIAWQNNCYNQPAYPGFYYGPDMDFARVRPEMEYKPVIYLAGDSTMQTYGEESRPQTGWGEAFLAYFENPSSHDSEKRQYGHGAENAVESTAKNVAEIDAENAAEHASRNAVAAYHRQDCPFEQEMCYESRHLIVDNCAMAGRSSKTFREEGRLDDIRKHLKPGDYLVIQFGHNDASASKAERYVPVDLFEESLAEYVNAAKAAGAVPILVSSIALRPCKENERGEVGEIGRKLPCYAEVMRRMAEKKKLIFVDMGELTRELCGQAGEAETGKWYREDHVHLVAAGAEAFAKVFAEAVRGVILA